MAGLTPGSGTTPGVVACGKRRSVPRGTPRRDPSRPNGSRGKQHTHRAPKLASKSWERLRRRGLTSDRHASDLVGKRPQPVSPQIGTHPTLLGACTEPSTSSGDLWAYTTPAPRLPARRSGTHRPRRSGGNQTSEPEGQRGGALPGFARMPIHRRLSPAPSS